MQWVSVNVNNGIPVIAEVDLLVVGGGIAGLSAAREVAQRGKKVLVIDAGTFLGYELTL